MKQKSWHLNRREMLKASGIALSLPFLESMVWGSTVKSTLPKRMVITYFSYGAYMPHGSGGFRIQKSLTMNGAGGPVKMKGL